MLVGGLLLMMVVGGPSVPAVADGGEEAPRSAFTSPPDTTAADTTNHPNREPYTTDRGVLYHVLATPAYVLHGATRPLGWGLRYIERNYPGVFDAELPPRGIVPLVELGGPTGVSGGLLVYDNQLFGSEHQARVEGLFGARDVFDVRGQYQMPSPLGPNSTFNLSVNFFSDPERSFFLGGNDSRNRADKTYFSRRQLDVTAGLQWVSPEGTVAGGLETLFEHVSVGRSDRTRGERLAALRPPGFTTVDLLTPRIWAFYGRTRGGRRPYLGTEVLLQLDYTHDLNGRQFRYGRYVAEIRQYLPVGLFPNTRRLALRGRLEQVGPMWGGTDVPFYQQPGLGGQSSLRGVSFDRFQDKGAVMMTAEYRYPIWMNLDAVVFTDAGQVFGALSDVAVDRFHWSYGGGVHLLNQRGLSARFEVAGGAEGVRTILTVQSSFRRTGR